jgi:hypothetical protein
VPNTTQRIDRIEAALEKSALASARTEANLDQLTKVVAAIAASVAAHDEQIEQLVKISEENARAWQQLRKEWQAYLRTLRPQ